MLGKKGSCLPGPQATLEPGSMFASPNLEVFETFQNFGLVWQQAFEEHKSVPSK